MPSDIVFDTIKEDRDWYFVKYSAPSDGFAFAVLNLIFPGTYDRSAVADAVEREARSWLERYPMPLTASAFDHHGNVYDLGGVRPYDSLAACPGGAGQEPMLAWRLLKPGEYPAESPTDDVLKALYPGVPFRTRESLRASARAEGRNVRVLVFFFVLWAAGVPAFIAILGYRSEIVGIATMVYSLAKAAIVALKLMGRWNPSARERAREAEELRMQHHDYHCTRNPEGFLRLKNENFEREAAERTAAEAAALKECKAVGATA